MTLDKLLRTYNFHDCYVIPPFKQQGNDITVVFGLAKHLQHGDIRSKTDPLYADSKHDLIVRIRFLGCTGIRAIEWNYPGGSAGSSENARKNEKITTIDQFDWKTDFDSVCMSEEKGIIFVFRDLQRCVGEITFLCGDVVVEAEELLDEAESDALWGDSE